MAVKQPGTRIVRETRFCAEGPDDGTLPVTFKLELSVQEQARDGRFAGGWAGTGAPQRSVLLEGLTRQEVALIIEDGAAALAWNGKD